MGRHKSVRKLLKDIVKCSKCHKHIQRRNIDGHWRSTAFHPDNVPSHERIIEVRPSGMGSLDGFLMKRQPANPLPIDHDANEQQEQQAPMIQIEGACKE